jgi:serine/threonine protein kinase
MAAGSSQHFLEALSDSTLLSAEKLTQAREIAQADPDPHRLAEALVKQEWVTNWQAKKLLAGKRHFHMGNYRLLDLVGRGGMGAVYRAEHIGLRRQVALKVMSQRYLNNPRVVSRFLAEIRMVSELDHPNIVKAFDADYEQSRYFLVMEYVAGRSLDHWLEQEGRFFVGWACEFIRQAALGLQHAAERKLIHRDIKPSNLIVPERPGENQPIVKLLDFGLAFCLGEGENFDFTQPGRTVGTLDYMAPEQSISSRNIDARTDIYSLGCVFYHLLTGKLPFEGRTAIERLTRRMKEPAPVLSLSRPDLPEELSQILDKMLNPDRNRRFRWPIEVSDALEPYAHINPSMPAMGSPPKRRAR